MALNNSYLDITSEINDDSVNKFITQFRYQKAWNYSVFVSLIGLLEIYYTVQILYEVAAFSNLGTKVKILYNYQISLVTLAMNIIWNSIICTLNFFLSINFEVNNILKSEFPLAIWGSFVYLFSFILDFRIKTFILCMEVALRAYILNRSKFIQV